MTTLFIRRGNVDIVECEVYNDDLSVSFYIENYSLFLLLVKEREPNFIYDILQQFVIIDEMRETWFEVKAVRNNHNNDITQYARHVFQNVAAYCGLNYVED